ncbi:MAG: hypothetical protein LBH58_07520 [Tannerellaceae bacterium]|nr:hypothetical protein [Tannerellaceae bacterium]
MRLKMLFVALIAACCSFGVSASVSVQDSDPVKKTGCCSSKQASADGEKKTGCCKSKTAMANGEQKSGCCKSKAATTENGEKKAGCCKSKNTAAASVDKAN